MAGSYKGKRVLVTGAGGFIGSHLTRALVQEGASVRALVQYNSRNDWGRIEGFPPDVKAALEVHAGDIRDPHYMERTVAGCEIVFHLAALIPIPFSYVAPGAFVDTNIRGTLHVLEACRNLKVARMVHTSTSETYGTAQTVPIHETHPLQGQSPYSASKIGADKLVESYHCSFETPVVTVRPFNTFGPGQSARAFLPTVITQALSGEVIRVGSLDPVRDMNYVEDTVRGFLAAGLAPGVEGRTFNLGSGRGVTMEELLHLAVKATGNNPRIETDPARVRPEGSEVLKLICDATAAGEALIGKSPVTLEEGVARTVAWIADHLDQYKPEIYNL